MDHLADPQRIGRLLAGDEPAVSEVRGWIRMAATPYRDLWRGEIDDLEQDALLELLAALRAGRFRGDSPLRSYVRMLVHHHCIDRLRAARRRPTVELEGLDPPALEEPPTSRLAREESVRIALAVLARTTAGCRELWRLLLAGRSYREMAAELGVEEGALRVRVLRCRRRALLLRDELSQGAGNAGTRRATSPREDDP